MGDALKPHIGDAVVIPGQLVEGVEASEMVGRQFGDCSGIFYHPEVLGGAQPGGGDCFTCPPVDPERTIATANCAVAGSRRVRFAGETPAENVVVTGASKHGTQSSHKDFLSKTGEGMQGDHGAWPTSSTLDSRSCIHAIG